MAKKDKKKDKKDSKAADTDALAAIRSAVERTLQASAEGASATRERTREIVDEIAAAAGRVRNTLEDMRILDEVKRLRSEVESLAARVAAYESKSAPSAKPAAKKPAAARKRSARKPAAAKKPPAPKPAIASTHPTPRAGSRIAREPASSINARKKVIDDPVEQIGLFQVHGVAGLGKDHET